MKNSVYENIANTFGTPIYVFDQKAFEKNYKDFVSAFQEIYPKYQLSYSYKTNYVPYVCECVKKLGGFAEVVSDMEYTLAKRLKYSNEKIVYNGPVKGPLMEKHLLAGGILNVDNLEEAKRISKLAEKHKDKQFRVGVRINLAVTDDFISRFGLELGSELLDETVNVLKACQNVSLVGIHGHSGHARSVASWKHRTETLIKAADQLIGGVPEYISLGSGMFGRPDERLARQFNCEIPTYVDYAEAVLRPIAEHYSGVADKPMVLTEPGATVISAYISFVTKVTDIKLIRGRYLAAVDGSFYNIGEISKAKQLPLDVIHNSKCAKEYEAIDIVGYTCLENDILYKRYCGPLSVGDYLVIGNVGGYSVVSKPQFIQPNCPMVAIDCEDNVIEIMRRESFDDVFSKFRFDM